MCSLLGNLETSFRGSHHAFAFRTYAARYLAAFAYRFNDRFDLATLRQRVLVAAVNCPPQPERTIRVAEVCC